MSLLFGLNCRYLYHNTFCLKRTSVQKITVTPVVVTTSEDEGFPSDRRYAEQDDDYRAGYI